MRAVLVFVIGVLFASCATQSGMREAVLNRAAFDLGCDKAKLQAVELASGRGGSSRIFGVTGCDKKASYVVHGDGVNGYIPILNSDSKNQ